MSTQADALLTLCVLLISLVIKMVILCLEFIQQVVCRVLVRGWNVTMLGATVAAVSNPFL